MCDVHSLKLPAASIFGLASDPSTCRKDVRDSCLLPIRELPSRQYLPVVSILKQIQRLELFRLEKIFRGYSGWVLACKTDVNVLLHEQRQACDDERHDRYDRHGWTIRHTCQRNVFVSNIDYTTRFCDNVQNDEDIDESGEISLND